MKFALVLISTSFLLSGFITSSQSLSVIGAIIFVIIQTKTLLDIYKLSKEYKNGNVPNNQEKRSALEKISYLIESLIIVYGLVAMVSEGIFFAAGAIIWVGIIVIYFIGGVFVRNLANIPLRFGYGGWQIYRRGKSK